MSCCITTSRLKKLEAFSLPIASLYKTPDAKWRPNNPEVIDVATNRVRVVMDTGQYLEGVLSDGILSVESLDLEDGAQHLLTEVLKPAFESSTGTLEVVNTWESGETERLSVVDGVVSETAVD